MVRRPRTSSAKATKAAPRGQIPKLSDDSERLLDSANDASGPAKNAWLAFLALLAYLLVTLGGVSHKDLLLNDPVTLPVVNVDIPLFSFLQVAPLLLLLVYLSLLIQHVMLAGKFRNFTEAIAPDEKKTGKEHRARQLVHSYVVAQLLAGPKRNPITRSLMRLMVFVTFVLLPVVTLLYFQIKFVPYHEVWVTYWHRIMVLLGLAMLFALLPIIQLKSRKREVKVLKREAVGMYEVAVLGAGSAEALKKWIDNHGFKYPDGMDDVCEDYVQEGWCFVAVKTKVGQKEGVEPQPGQRGVASKLPAGSTFDGHVQGMGFRFKVDELVVPMRLGAFNDGELRNVVYLLTDGTDFYSLMCRAPDAPEDRWLSVAETIEFLPVESPEAGPNGE